MGVGDLAVAEVEDVFAEVPDRPGVVLSVEVVGHLVDAAAEEGDVLRDERLHAPALPLDDPRFGQQRDLGPERLAVHAPQ